MTKKFSGDDYKTVLVSFGLPMCSLPRVTEKSSGPHSDPVDDVDKGWRMFPIPPRPVDSKERLTRAPNIKHRKSSQKLHSHEKQSVRVNPKKFPGSGEAMMLSNRAKGLVKLLWGPGDFSRPSKCGEIGIWRWRPDRESKNHCLYGQQSEWSILSYLDLEMKVTHWTH